jgi:hypothetical protein
LISDDFGIPLRRGHDNMDMPGAAIHDMQMPAANPAMRSNRVLHDAALLHVQGKHRLRHESACGFLDFRVRSPELARFRDPSAFVSSCTFRENLIDGPRIRIAQVDERSL